jgi:tRNA(Ile)-lysidine synthase TilS/MesJ
MNPKESNRLRDKIIEILEQHCTDNTGTDVRPLYPLLHWIESELHEYGTNLQGKILDIQTAFDDVKKAYELEQEHNIELVERIEELEEVNATQTEKLELAQQVIKSIHERETYSEVQIIAKNYLSDQSPEFLCQP